MNKYFYVPVILVGLLFLTTACGIGNANAEPTAMTFPTALATETQVAVNPTALPPAGNIPSGQERVSDVDGMVQIYIPEGSFRMGGMDAWTTSDEQPPHNVAVKGFWIDKVEVTNAIYMLCVQAGACEPPRLFTSTSRETYFNNQDYANYPVIMVRWSDADAYCTWAGRRLPYEAEWERAARGDDFRTWPWGDEKPDNSRANFNYTLRDTTQVGSYPAGASPYGVLDMAGNVWEWVMDWYDADYYLSAQVVNPSGPLAASQDFRRVIRGGSWADGNTELRVANRGFSIGGDEKAAVNSEAYNGVYSNTVGFRCVSDQ